ncbi:MFS transporter [Nocardioides anomalus]|uniref:MFS transporter n=1 Tax=Nocardioides anomalus TaxID=2712223 RepID=A0A6G6WLG0_9ACTN|nr:MFS transporter [Nocardioides anomalus]
MVALSPAAPPAHVLAARNAVVLVFALNGLLMASLVARVPDLRSGLDLGNGALGLLLLCIAFGSVLALPSAGFLIHRHSAGWVVRLGVVADGIGLIVGGTGAALGSVPLAGAGLFVFGIGTGVWDVAMNVEGAEVERGLRRSIMPRFHAAWSFGSIAGAAVGVPAAALHVPLPVHLGVLSVVAGVAVSRGTGSFLPALESAPTERGLSAWREPRVLAIGVMVLAFAVVEGTANDWLSLALIDGYDVAHWVGVSGYALFVCAMTVGRLTGPVVLDRWGRAPVLWVTTVAAAAGILLVVLGSHPVVVGLGILVWGLGAALGFPVGMSAAADDPTRAAARVSVVSTIGYGAFLGGPPLLGWLGDHVGTLDALLAVAFLMLPAALTVFASRTPAVTSATSA